MLVSEVLSAATLQVSVILTPPNIFQSLLDPACKQLCDTDVLLEKRCQKANNAVFVASAVTSGGHTLFSGFSQPCSRDQCSCLLRGLLPLPWNTQCCRQPELETGLSGFKVTIHISFIFGVHINIAPIQISCVFPPALWGPAVLCLSTSCQCTQGMAEIWKFSSCLYEFKQLMESRDAFHSPSCIPRTNMPKIPLLLVTDLTAT